MIPSPALDLSALSAIPAEEWERPMSEQDQDAIRTLCIERGVPVPECLERRAETREPEPDFRASTQ